MNVRGGYGILDSDTQEGPVIVTAEVIRRACKKHNGYSTPDLNEKIYLNHLGLSGLSSAFNAYVNCTALYLDHNALHDLMDLAGLIHLKSLYLAFNALDTATAWPRWPALEHLDVSHNFLKHLDGVVGAAPGLRVLLASHNQIDHLGEALDATPALTSLDLSYNALGADPLTVVAALTRRGETLATCVLAGNPLTRGLPDYRRRLLLALPGLRSLDERPVAAVERERAEAFHRGGPSAEREQIEAIRAREDAEAAARNAFFEATCAAARAAAGLSSRGEDIVPLTHLSS